MSTWLNDLGDKEINTFPGEGTFMKGTVGWRNKVLTNDDATTNVENALILTAASEAELQAFVKLEGEVAAEFGKSKIYLNLDDMLNDFCCCCWWW